MTDFHPLAGKKVAILIATGFDEVEMTEPQRALLRMGATPKTISTQQGLVNGWHGTAWGHYFPVDQQMGEVLAVDFDLLLLPGGERSVTKLAENPHTRRIISSFMDAGKGIAAVGDGVRLLATAPQRLRGRHVTGSAMAKDAVVAEGAIWNDTDSMVEDGYLLTAGKLDKMDEFIEAMTRVFTASVEIRQQAA